MKMFTRQTVTVGIGLLVSLNLSAQEYVPAGAGRAQLGQGFDSLTGELKPTICARGTIISDNEFSSKSGMESKRNVSIVKSLEDVRKQTAESASASFGWGLYRGSISAKFIDDQLVSKYTESILVDTKVTKEEVVLRNPSIDERVGTIPKDHSNLAFRKVCGDKFVSGITRGGRYTVSFTQTDLREQRHASSSGSIAVAYAKISGSADGSSSLDVLKSMSDLKVTAINRGPGGSDPGNSVKEIVEYEKSFRSKFDDNAPSLDMNYAVDSYASIEPDINNPADVRDYLEELGIYYGRAVTYVNGLKVIAESLKVGDDAFGSFSSDALDEAIKDWEKHIRDVERNARSCKESFSIVNGGCEFLKTNERNIPVLPSAAIEVAINPAEARWFDIGTTAPDRPMLIGGKGGFYSRCPGHEGPTSWMDGKLKLFTVDRAPVEIVKFGPSYQVPASTKVQYTHMDWSTTRDNCVFPEGFVIKLIDPFLDPCANPSASGRRCR